MNTEEKIKAGDITTVSYLALGDSYTIGEQVPIAHSFPYQVVQLLRKNELIQAAVENPDPNYLIPAPEIIATTGWTTDELSTAIGNTIFLQRYNIVSLLIGVNDQYRGRPATEFKKEFEPLIQMAVQFAGGIAKNVFIISIPDWGVTPFAEGKDREKIAAEIDAYNQVCMTVANNIGVIYIDITGSQREDGKDPEFLAPDGLHPSGKEYTKWAKKISEAVMLNDQLPYFSGSVGK